MNKSFDFLTPVGRLVAGDVFKGNTTDLSGRPLLIKNGPNAGQPKKEFYFAVAIKKDEPKFKTDVMDKLTSAAKAGFPTLFDASGKCTRADFALKITDGDSTTPNQNGTIPSSKIGYAGCWVLSFKSGFAPKVYTQGGTSLLTDPDSVKRGYYVRVYARATANGEMQKPGLYLNPSMVELVGYGDVIESEKHDGSRIFGPVELPDGASPTPIATTPLNTGFLSPPKMYVFQGKTFTERQLKELGWTDETIGTLACLPF